MVLFFALVGRPDGLRVVTGIIFDIAGIIEGKLSLPLTTRRGMLVAMVGVTVFGGEMQMVAATSGRREGAQVAHRGHCAGKRGLQ